MSAVSKPPVGDTATARVLRAVSKSYVNPDGVRVDVLRDVDLCLETGRVTVVVGRNGVGKSTLLRVVAGIEPPSSGAVFWTGPYGSRPEVGLMYQEVEESLLPWRTNLGNVALGLEAIGVAAHSARNQAAAFAERFGLPIPLGNYPGTSSGGQRQMTAVARAAVLRPALLALDEPFSKIDPSLVWLCRRFLITYVRGERPAALVITHSLDEAISIADEVHVLRGSQTGATLDFVTRIDTPDSDRTAWQRSDEYLRLRLAVADAVEGTPG